MHERQDPGAGLAALRHETSCGAPQREECLLNGVLCEGLIAKNAEGEAIGGPPEAVVELGERRLLGSRSERDQRLVREMGQLPVHMCRSPSIADRFTA